MSAASTRHAIDVGELRAYGALLCMAVVPIVAGAASSLKMPKVARTRLHSMLKQQKKLACKAKIKALPSSESDSDASDDDSASDEDEDTSEAVSLSDAYAFPILGSIVLFGLYLCFKYLDPKWVNFVIGKYLALMGVGSVARATVKLARGSGIVSDKTYRQLAKYSVVKTEKNSEPAASSKSKPDGQKRDRSSRKMKTTEMVSTNLVQVASLVFALVLTVYQSYRPNWIIANGMALAFAFNAISLMALDSFVTGSVLLALLFFYDIWWVFGSKRAFGADVMVSVATKLDAPIKVTFPRDMVNMRGFSLLGLGDIVLPGIFVALAMRFDYHQALQSSLKVKDKLPLKPTARFPKPYFRTSLVAYVAGLVTTICVMHTFKAAQPALLYLSPACILSVIGCAISRNELQQLWSFQELDDEEEESKNKNE
ncbi:hypothetical protein OIV83_000912 [Microbotryomycetes sp. JL201]|nr:hypothetical protein OIV83_000912 [Microbotryomycetes sp. JL201]